VNIRFHHAIARYLFAIAAVASTFALSTWLIPFTGTDAPFGVLFAAVLVTSLVAGIGPGICSLVINLPLAVYIFMTRAGRAPVDAALLLAIDGASALGSRF